jgi:hypothetical protein
VLLRCSTVLLRCSTVLLRCSTVVLRCIHAVTALRAEPKRAASPVPEYPRQWHGAAWMACVACCNAAEGVATVSDRPRRSVWCGVLQHGGLGCTKPCLAATVHIADLSKHRFGSSTSMIDRPTNSCGGQRLAPPSGDPLRTVSCRVDPTAGLTPSACAPGGPTPPPTSAPGLGYPLPHLRRDCAFSLPFSRPPHLPTSPPRLGSPLPRLHRHWGRPLLPLDGNWLHSVPNKRQA